jgi:pimeloyl-ACP methyl ester carboxylesterase
MEPAPDRSMSPFITRRSRSRARGRTYVLVHGAWHGGWVWGAVAEGLRDLGHIVFAPSLTGLGDRRHLRRPGVNLDTHADDIVNLVELEGLENIVLVGWSYGGMVISDVLGRIPEKIASMVYLDAYAPERGRSMLNYAQRGASVDEAIQLAIRGEDLPPLPLEVMGATDPEVAAFVGPRVTPQPVMTVLQASKAPAERPNIPHTYVLAGINPSPTFKPFHELFEGVPFATTHVIDAGHMMMIRHPKETEELLAKVR